MSNPTPAPDVAALRALCDAAPYYSGHLVAHEDAQRVTVALHPEDWRIFKDCRTALPQLLDRVEALESRLARLTAALESVHGWAIVPADPSFCRACESAAPSHAEGCPIGLVRAALAEP